MNVGDIIVKIKANLSDFEKGIGRATSKIKGFSKESITASNKVALGLAGAATAMGALAFSAVKTTGDLEAMRMGFVTLLGSADKADAVMTRIKKEAASTPFELAGLTRGTQALATITKDGDKAIDMLLNVGKAVSASGKGAPEMDRIILNLQQIASTGKITAMDIRQFQGAIPAFTEMIEKSTGKSMESLKDSGELTSEVVMKAFEDAGSAGGMFADAFANQAGTFNQLWSNMMDNIVIFGSEFVKQTGIFDTVKNALSVFVNYVDNNSETMIAWAKNLMEYIKDNGYIVAGILLGALAPALYGVASGIWAVISPLLPFIAIGVALGLIIKKLIDYLGGWGNIMVIIQPALDNLKLVVGLIWSAILSLWGTIKDQLLPELQKLWDLISPVLIPVLKFLAIVLGLALVGAILAVIYVIKGIVWVISQMINGFIQSYDIVKSWVLGVIDYFKTLYNGISNYINTIIDVFNGWKDGTLGIADGIKMIFSSMWDSIKNTFKSGVNAVIKPLNTAISGFNKVPGINIPMIPQLAEGGIVTRPTLAMVGEAGPEAVVPLDKAGGMGNITINVPASPVDDSTQRAYAEKIAKSIDDVMKGKGQSPVFNLDRI